MKAEQAETWLKLINVFIFKEESVQRCVDLTAAAEQV